MTAPAVSIIVPAYRAASYLRTAIPRLESQEFDDFEVIVVDDGSGDDTAETAVALADAHPRVHAVILEHNGGVAHARRRALAVSRGEFAWFIDADDAWPDTALGDLVDAARREDADVVVAGAQFVYQDGSTRALPAPHRETVDGVDAFRMLLRGEITGHLWNKLFRTEVMAQASFAQARVQSDLIMVADALSHAERVAFTAETVYEYRLRAGSIITSTSKRAESLAIIDAAVTADAARLGIPEDDEDLRYFRARYIQLSGIKDALLAAYDDRERRRHLDNRRGALSVRDVLLFARRGDARRFALAATAKTSLTVHRALLRAADR